MSEMDEDQENIVSQRRKSSKERKECFRLLLNKIEDIRESDDISVTTAKQLKDVLKQVNILDNECPIAERIKNADETLLDSHVLSSASSLLVKYAEAVDMKKITYNSMEYAEKLNENVKTDEGTLDILSLVNQARKIIPTNPELSFLGGTFDHQAPPPPKIVKERQKYKTQEPVEKKILQKIVNAEQEEESIGETVRFLLKVLKEEYTRNGENPILYYDYVIDKSSFAKTVDNIFYCAFLIRDGTAELDLDEENRPTLKPVRKKDLKAFRNQEGGNTQIVMSMNMEKWNGINVTEGFLQRHQKSQL